MSPRNNAPDQVRSDCGGLLEIFKLARLIPTLGLKLGPEASESRLKIQEWGQGHITCNEAWA